MARGEGGGGEGSSTGPRINTMGPIGWKCKPIPKLYTRRVMGLGAHLRDPLSPPPPHRFFFSLSFVDLATCANCAYRERIENTTTPPSPRAAPVTHDGGRLPLPVSAYRNYSQVSGPPGHSVKVVAIAWTPDSRIRAPSRTTMRAQVGVGPSEFRAYLERREGNIRTGIKSNTHRKKYICMYIY